MRYLIKQAIIVPVLFFVPLLMAGLMVDDYDWVKQHGSEITVTDFTQAKLMINSGAIATGISCLLLSIGILVSFKRFYLTSVLLAIFGISMVSNGVFPMGTLMHGLYGIGLSLMILPFVACYELKNSEINSRFFNTSLIAGFVIFVYLWAMLIGLDPANYRGLTQRIASVFIFGWIAYLAFELSKMLPETALSS